MALLPSCLAYEKEQVYVVPFYGWGWNLVQQGKFLDLTQDETQGPAPFHIRIRNFYHYRGELTGATGIVEEPGHLCNHFFVAFYVRQDKADFTENISAYNIQLGTHDPILELRPDNDEEDWPHWNFGESVCVMGFCDIARDKTTFEQWYKRKTQHDWEGSTFLSRLTEKH